MYGCRVKADEWISFLRGPSFISYHTYQSLFSFIISPRVADIVGKGKSGREWNGRELASACKTRTSQLHLFGESVGQENLSFPRENVQMTLAINAHHTVFSSLIVQIRLLRVLAYGHLPSCALWGMDQRSCMHR